MYELTKEGVEKYKMFIAECRAKTKEILDSGKDTADETMLPTIEDIECDIENYIDDDGDYYNCWGVTDNYSSDFPICLKLGIDFERR